MIDSASEQPASASGNQHDLVGIEELRRLGHEMHARHDDDARVALGRLARERQAVADHVGNAMEDLWRLVVVREDDRVALALEPEDRLDVRLEGRPFERRNDAAHALIEGPVRDGLAGSSTAAALIAPKFAWTYPRPSPLLK